MMELNSIQKELDSLGSTVSSLENDNDFNESPVDAPKTEGEFCPDCLSRDKLLVELLQITSEISVEELDKIIDFAAGLISPSYKPEEVEEKILSEAGRHISAKQKIAKKIYRRKPRVQLALKKRRARNKLCPPGMTYSSKTNSCTLKDPKRSLAMKRAAINRRSF